MDEPNSDYDLTLPTFFEVKSDNGAPVVALEATALKSVEAMPHPQTDKMEGITGGGGIEDEMSYMINALTFVQQSEPITNFSMVPFTFHTFKDPHLPTRSLTYLLGDTTYITKLIPEGEFTPMKGAVQKVYATLKNIKDFQQRIDNHLKSIWCSMPMYDKHMLNSPILVHLFGNMAQVYPIYSTPYAIAHELLSLVVLCESSVNDAVVPKSYLPEDKDRATKYVKDVGRAYEGQLNQLNIWFHDAMKGLLKNFPTLLETMWKLPEPEAQLNALLKSTKDDEKQKEELIQKYWVAVEAYTATIPNSLSISSDPNVLTMGAIVHQVFPMFEKILSQATLAMINLMEAKVLNLLGWTCNYPSALAAQRQYSMVWPTINSIGSSEYLAQVPKVWRCFFTKHAVDTPMVIQRKYWSQQLQNTVTLSDEKKQSLLAYIDSGDMDNLWTYATVANALNTTQGHMALLRQIYEYRHNSMNAAATDQKNNLKGTTWADGMLSHESRQAIKTTIESTNIDELILIWQRIMLSELQVFTHKFMR